jgi:putative two-component system protein, hydrogenase maturation factor HypX/HoxX
MRDHIERVFGLVDRILQFSSIESSIPISRLACSVAIDSDLDVRLLEKGHRPERDEADKPLDAYRSEELARLHLNFYGFDPSYHVARYNFIRKVPKSRTPLTLARRRSQRLRTTFDPRQP